MKYLSQLALIGLINAKTALVIDDQKIVETAGSVEGALIQEAQKPAGQAVAAALEKQLNIAALKIEMGYSKVMSPIIGAIDNAIYYESVNSDCQVHKYYQCLVNNGVQDQPWMAPQSCKDQTDCNIRYREMTGKERKAYREEMREYEDEIMEAEEELLEPIFRKMEKAYVKNAANVAQVQADLGPALKNILTDYGCDASCLANVPLDVVSIAQASTYCWCPEVVEVRQTMPGINNDVTKILTEMGVPKTVPKKEASPTVNLAATTPEVAPQTNYMSTGMMAAGVFIGGYLFGKNKAVSKGDDTYTQIL